MVLVAREFDCNFLKDKKEYPASTTSTTFAFLWKQGKRRMLRVPLFDERNGQKLFFRGTSGTCRKKNCMKGTDPKGIFMVKKE